MTQAKSESFGLAYPIKRKSDNAIVGLKIFAFKDDGATVDYENGILMWRSDVEATLNGRMRTPVYVNQSLPQVKQKPVKQ